MARVLICILALYSCLFVHIDYLLIFSLDYVQVSSPVFTPFDQAIIREMEGSIRILFCVFDPAVVLHASFFVLFFIRAQHILFILNVFFICVVCFVQAYALLPFMTTLLERFIPYFVFNIIQAYIYTGNIIHGLSSNKEKNISNFTVHNSQQVTSYKDQTNFQVS